MNNIGKYLFHLVVLCVIQIIILNNIHLNSYLYINIYILGIYLLPYRMKGISLLLFGFALGLLMDFADNTIGVHAAASTFVAYIRPRLLLTTSNRDEVDEFYGVGWINDSGWFLKYVALSTLLFYVVLIFAEAFTFTNFFVSLLRIIFSTFISVIFIILYYWIGIKKVNQK